MAVLITRECKICNQQYQVEYKRIKYQAKVENKLECDVKLTCGKICARKLIHLEKFKIINCGQCNCAFEIRIKNINPNGLNFCCKSCSAIFSNKKRKNIGYTTKNKTIKKMCSSCNLLHSFSIHRNKNAICKTCANKRSKEKRLKAFNNKTCVSCNVTATPTTQSRYCKECFIRRRSDIGKKSAAKRQKRSKAEIYLSELCIKHNLNIKCNSQLFDGWDCDIALLDYNLAIMWNGPFHYKECGGSHSLAQTQNRDKIKIKAIIKNGWSPYIIEDKCGKFKENFVNEKFTKLLLFLETHYQNGTPIPSCTVSKAL